jgi:hypothetical protein
MFFDKSATKKCCFKLDLQWNQMILTLIFWGFGLLYFNVKFNVITTRTMGYFFGITFLFSPLFFPKKFTIKGYSMKSYFIKLIESQSIHRKNIVLAIFATCFFINTIFCFFDFDVDLPYFTYGSYNQCLSCSSSLPTFQFFEFCDGNIYFFGF